METRLRVSPRGENVSMLIGGIGLETRYLYIYIYIKQNRMWNFFRVESEDVIRRSLDIM